MKRDDVVYSTRLAGQVKRYSSWPTTRAQSVGEHTWSVMDVYCSIFGSPRSEVWYYMLHHDTAEMVTGDLPFPVKMNNPDLKNIMDSLEIDALKKMGVIVPELTSEEKLRVKVCDKIEMWCMGMEELTRGNKFGLPIMEDTWQAINDIMRGSEDLGKVRSYMRRYESWRTT